MNLILLEQSDFVDGETVRLDGRRLEHVRGVHGAAVGQTLRVGLLGGKIGQGRVEALSDTEVVLRIRLDRDPPPPLDVALLLALPRPKSLKKALAAAVTMGVKRIILMRSWRVEPAYWQSPVLQEQSLRELAVLALEQARDTILPNIETRRKFRPFVEEELPGISRDTCALLAHPEAGDECPAAVPSPVTLAIGPEGGFVDFELGLLETLGFRPISLGPRPLRVEQAVAALLGRLR